jgi:hypothetical protein
VNQEADVRRAVDWLRAVGADAIVMHEAQSAELFHQLPARKFADALPVLWTNGEGDVFYRIPRRFPAHARVLETRVLDALRPVQFISGNRDQVKAYADAVEGGPDAPVEMRWLGPDEIRLHARLRPGDTLLVQESYDPAWRAEAGGRRLVVRRDAMDFMRIDAAPGEQDVRLTFRVPLENRVGRVVSGLAVLVVLGLWALGRVFRSSIVLR